MCSIKIKRLTITSIQKNPASASGAESGLCDARWLGDLRRLHLEHARDALDHVRVIVADALCEEGTELIGAAELADAREVVDDVVSRILAIVLVADARDRRCDEAGLVGVRRLDDRVAHEPGASVADAELGAENVVADPPPPMPQRLTDQRAGEEDETALLELEREVLHPANVELRRPTHLADGPLHVPLRSGEEDRIIHDAPFAVRVVLPLERCAIRLRDALVLFRILLLNENVGHAPPPMRRNFAHRLYQLFIKL